MICRYLLQVLVWNREMNGIKDGYLVNSVEIASGFRRGLRTLHVRVSKQSFVK